MDINFQPLQKETIGQWLDWMQWSGRILLLIIFNFGSRAIEWVIKGFLQLGGKRPSLNGNAFPSKAISVTRTDNKKDIFIFGQMLKRFQSSGGDQLVVFTYVAIISENGEREIGELLTRAMEKVGKERVITFMDGNTLENELEVVEGMKLARSYISPYFITDQKTQKCVQWLRVR